MSWSPDYEIVVFTTGNDTVLMMTKDWDVLAEHPVPIIDRSKGFSKDTLPAISWRGDGAFFVCSSTGDNGMRQIYAVTLLKAPLFCLCGIDLAF
jgi:elongator complex protein 1